MHPGEPGPLVRSMPGVPPGASPAAGPAAYSGLFSLAGAVGSATGLSLRSPRTVKIFFRDAGNPPAAPAQSLSLPAEKHLARPGPAGCPPALLRLRAFRRRNTPQPRPRRRGPARRKARHEPHQLRRDHHLRQAGCGAITTLADSIYVDGCGQICRECDEAIFGPLPSWWDRSSPRSDQARLGLAGTAMCEVGAVPLGVGNAPAGGNGRAIMRRRTAGAGAGGKADAVASLRGDGCG